MQIAIIIPVHNRLELTKKTLFDLSDNVKDIHECAFPIVLVDDGSSDGTASWVAETYPAVHILQGNGNLWWSGGVNLGVKYALEELKTDYILLWNNDITVVKNYFQTLLHILKNSNNKTIIGSKILVAEKPDIVWSMGGYFDPVSGKHGMFGYFEKNDEKYEKALEVDWLAGMGTVIPGNIIEKIGYWDNINFPQYHGDSDFTYRAKRKGYSVIVHPALKIYNRTKSSGIDHSGSFKQLLRLMTDNRSKINFRKNLMFYRLYAKSYRAFLYLYWRYCLIFGGFFKWKVLEFLGVRKKRIY
ncbi:MAG: glycosyltransferase family 2 protein [Bacteroidales bacterium]|nr:glycosyltransferase family 2 protein [Bacteroidales bacterium]